ncbi:hypothetical protein [Thauera sinica]|uniref:Uncharacterized protein n=1 Tax=Thauera sinica TaxID=2665146 RepID=A0ABW1AKV8_9RHOO|nr:hypothetical protein [Thauera sp. K11]
MAITIEEMQAEVTPEREAPAQPSPSGASDGAREAELMERIAREQRVRDERMQRVAAD